MAELIVHDKKIRHNIKYLSQYFKEHNIKWSLITKVFSGDKEFLKNVLTDDVIQDIGSVGDSRLTSLKNLRAVNPQMRTIYIKPPAKIYADEVVKYANISLNTSIETIAALNEAAAKINVIHEVIIMLELGELREGIERSDLVAFYRTVMNYANINVVGIGSNLGCMYGVEPTHEKLIELTQCKKQIFDAFNKELPLVSGGTSITLPLIESGLMPKEINHFRIGEAVFFGVSPLNNVRFKELMTDTFEFNANIIELEEKKIVPDGIIGDAHIGLTAQYNDSDVLDSSYKAILDFGLLDVNQLDLEFIDIGLKFVGITSDMLVIDIGNNTNENGGQRYKIGGVISFSLNYMAVARLLSSKFIDKKYDS